MNDTLWLYWQGPKPPLIELCLQTVLRHNPGARVLDRAAFDQLWDADRDLPIDSLALNHQSDYIRAFLLQRHGGMYIDADCIVLRRLDPLIDMAAVQGFVGYREPQGYMSCNFMAARAGGAVIGEHYRRVCARLRNGQPLQWLDLASVPMDQAVAIHPAEALLLPTASVMPVPWNESHQLALPRDTCEHARQLAPSAWCYMLSNNTLKTDERTRHLWYAGSDELLTSRSQLGHLLRHALALPQPADTQPAGPLPGHLGGHEEKTQFDEGAFDFLVQRLGARSFLDVGCGPAGMVHYARHRGLRALGVDGDPMHIAGSQLVVQHDYEQGPLEPEEFDLGWAVEFVEHVHERFIPHFMATFACCSHVFITAAVPGQPGHHHVNCQPAAYWIERFDRHGFDFDEAATRGVRAASKMISRFTEQTGLVFRRRS